MCTIPAQSKCSIIINSYYSDSSLMQAEIPLSLPWFAPPGVFLLLLFISHLELLCPPVIHTFIAAHTTFYFSGLVTLSSYYMWHTLGQKTWSTILYLHELTSSECCRHGKQSGNENRAASCPSPGHGSLEFQPLLLLRYACFSFQKAEPGLQEESASQGPKGLRAWQLLKGPARHLPREL